MTTLLSGIKTVAFAVLFVVSLPFQVLVWIVSLIVGFMDMWRMRHP